MRQDGAMGAPMRATRPSRDTELRRVLDLGAGHEPRPAGPGEEVVTMDWFTTARVDVRHSFLDTPFPFEDASFDEVHASHVMEHVPPKLDAEDRDVFFSVMAEIHRILRPRGRLVAITPFAGSTVDHCHVGHYRHFIPETWERFCDGLGFAENEGYRHGTFRMRRWRITKWEPRLPYTWPVGSYRRHLLTHLWVRSPFMKRHGVFGRPAELTVELEKVPAGRPAHR